MLIDKRVDKLADIIVNYSTRVKAGDHVLIRTSPAARPLVEAVYRLVVRQGAHPTVQMSFSSLSRIYYEEASNEQLAYLNPIQKFTTEKSDVLISIHAPENARELTEVDADKIRRAQVTNQPLQQHVMQSGVRWLVCNFPTPGLAQEANMSVASYADFVFNATNIDWQAASAMMHQVKDRFDSANEVRIIGTETDLTFSIEGRPGIVCDGEFNMPDGEVFYGPVEDSVNGTIYYELPAIYMGREVTGVRLTFEDGRVIDAQATQGEALLHQLLDSDEGARRLGEFGIGCNYGITRHTRDILFDEKIGGTVHLALGSAYPESGGTNESAIHWDMVKDLRDGGQLFLDGDLVQSDGRFLFLDE